MKKLLFIAIILIFGIALASAQPCLPGGIHFYSQAEIDDFQANNPNCTEIEGYVHIGGNDITNLNGLNVLTSTGGLWIADMDSITSLTGLHNITFVGATLYIRDLPGLTDLSGLSSLIYIGGTFWIWNNSSLTDFSSLSNVISIERLDIFNNDALTTLSGLDNIAADSLADIYIVDNNLLTICEVQCICDYLSMPSADVIIEDNALGCNSIEEVEEACESVSIGEQYMNSRLTIYPNPTNHKVKISMNDGRELTEVSIYTLTGQQVLRERPECSTINISHLQPGMYIVEVTVEGRKVRQKLLVE